MVQESRKKEILKILDEHESLSVQELEYRFKVSQMTIRRDLTDLETQGYLIRKYGGAVKSEAVDSLFSFNKRLEENGRQKEKICRIASSFIEDDDVIFIDCGTTLFRLSHYIQNKTRLRVITNSLPVVSELINYSNINITFIGGDVVGDRKASYGDTAERLIGEYHADKAFIGADGVSLSKGLSSYDEKEARITRKMAENADKVFLLCDSSKIEKNSFYRFAPVSLINVLITERKISGEETSRYRDNDISIITKTEEE
ncbi:MAG: DeoR/GlpR transcriptional regulator [Spirochaetes bacterium]|nr:MAG: DeoR/GlpR transcriptional regulator [Spirochaetota bacterium]RKX98426.1 MAG: DeoR/GlpR transcriptional regulator [Spirochaetota bacterium]